MKSVLQAVEVPLIITGHSHFESLNEVVKAVGKSCAIIDCFCMLNDDQIRRYFELGCEVKGMGRGHIQRIKEQVRKRMPEVFYLMPYPTNFFYRLYASIEPMDDINVRKALTHAVDWHAAIHAAIHAATAAMRATRGSSPGPSATTTSASGGGGSWSSSSNSTPTPSPAGNRSLPQTSEKWPIS